MVDVDVFDRDVPQHRGARPHLLLDLLSGLDGGQTGVEGDPTATGGGGEPDGIGIDDRRYDILRP
jgi:hypothetical protein